MFRKKQGYTITELMVTLFIFGFLVLMGVGAVNYATGKLKSSKNLELSEAMRLTMDTLNQKMNTANGKANIGTNQIYGFRVISNALVAVNTTGASAKCSIFKLINQQIKYINSTCPAAIPADSDVSWQALSPANVNVTTFTLTPNYFMTSATRTTIPFINVLIHAEEKNNATNYIELKTGYYLNYI